MYALLKLSIIVLFCSEKLFIIQFYFYNIKIISINLVINVMLFQELNFPYRILI